MISFTIKKRVAGLRLRAVRGEVDICPDQEGNLLVKFRDSFSRAAVVWLSSLEEEPYSEVFLFSSHNGEVKRLKERERGWQLRFYFSSGSDPIMELEHIFDGDERGDYHCPIAIEELSPVATGDTTLDRVGFNRLYQSWAKKRQAVRYAVDLLGKDSPEDAIQVLRGTMTE